MQQTLQELELANEQRAVLLPTQPSFAGHGTFALRSGWLKKGLDALRTPGQSSIFNAPEALAELGVGKNMVSAIRYWLLVTRMAREDGARRELLPTTLGRELFLEPAYDPYLEDDATLWLLHWNLCGPRSASFTWAYTFNLLRDWEFGRAALVEAIEGATAKLGKQPARETIDRDVGCLLQCYVAGGRAGSMSEDHLDCPLRGLDLLRESHKGHYRFSISDKPTLPHAIFFYALATFWNWKSAHSRTLPVWEICHAPGSPGQVFKLDENSVLEYLDALEDATAGQMRFEDTAQTRQVVLQENAAIPLAEFLHRYYAAQF